MTMLQLYSYLGTFEWEGKKHQVKVNADCKTVAFSSCCLQLERKLGVSHYTLRNYFVMNGDKYDITKTKGSNEASFTI